jgi:peptidoglycan/LPS O-acetylase OafA/YrhL
LKYRSEIDGLRALAVIPVILFHAGFSSFSGGFVGVDIFFVISGYLITSIIIKEIHVNNFSISYFYERRARRILPALFFITFCTIPFAWLLLPPQYMEDYALSIIGVIFFVSNFFFWRSSGYFSSESELQPLLHTWSLAVEEQFYILFPLFLILTWRFGKKIVLAMLLLIFIFSITLSDWASVHQPTFDFFLLPTRGWELLIGSFIAFYLNHSKSYDLPKYLSEILCFLGLSLIIYSIIFFDYMTPFPGRYALVPTVGTAMIILFSQSTNVFKSLLSGKFIVGIGLISYSAYLLHQPMLAFARHSQINELSEFSLILICLMVFPFAYLIWKYIETPFRKADRMQLKKIIYLATLSSILLFTFGLFGKLSSGYFERLSPNQIQLINSISSSPKRIECHTSGSNFLPP